MSNFIDERREDLDRLCRRFHVKTLEVFGSAASGSFDAARSDVDFLVDFLPLSPGAHADAYFGLWFALRDLFRREVDLVETPAIKNPYFLRAIDRQRQVLYAA
jgi:predicted nucleotidyltransferase